MSEAKTLTNRELLKTAVDELLSHLSQEREREIIARRFGLYDRIETLEQIGEFLGITRERVRQLEKAILIRLKIAAEEKQIEHLPALEKIIIQNLVEQGQLVKVSTLANLILQDATKRDCLTLAFIGEVSNELILLHESDLYFQAIGIADYKGSYSKEVDEIVAIIKKNKQPLTIQELDQQVNYHHPNQLLARAKISKKIANLNNLWGLSTWSSVNPKNIKDKIYVILKSTNKPMHFSEISNKIATSNFKRKNVTRQAIHNELIKDNRFILIGRGIYALKEWGYLKGTVAQVIANVIQENGKPMYRDDIVKQVLKRRKVKETTVLLNLQARPEFKRVAKATYDFIQQPS